MLNQGGSGHADDILDGPGPLLLFIYDVLNVSGALLLLTCRQSLST